MTNTDNLKQKLGEQTQKAETKAKELFTKYSPFYTKLEPWQRGAVIITLILVLLLTIYWLTSTAKNRTEILRERLQREKETQMEEKMIRQLALFKKLRD